LTTKAFSTSTQSIDILAGTSLNQMNVVGTLDPQSVSILQTPLSQEVQARYVSLKHHLPQQDWAKANTQLIKAYDQYGYFGPPRKPIPKLIPLPKCLESMEYGVGELMKVLRILKIILWDQCFMLKFVPMLVIITT